MSTKISLFSRPKTISLKNLILFVLLCLSSSIYAQHKVGVRAGTQYSKFRGPLEQDETLSFGSGIHFGINYTYMFADGLGVRAEILYAQRGSKQAMQSDDVYSIVRPLVDISTRIFEEGTVDYSLKYSNSYFSLPITLQYQMNKKFEVFGGMSVDFLIGANGRGNFNFDSKNNPEEVFYDLSYDHRYNSDLASGFTNLGVSTDVISILIDGDVVNIPKVVGAYYGYQPGTEVENRFKSVDFSGIVGLNYFINPGFYIGGRLEYGLLDLTRNSMDVSLRDLNEDNSFILRDDNDKNITLSFSFGFRF